MNAVRFHTLVRLLAGFALTICGCAWPQIAAAQSEIVEYYGHDAIGSLRVVFDAAGTVVGRGDYLPFGEELSASGLPAERFTGQARDPEAGLDYFKARSYQSRTGRFGRVDPIFTGPFKPQAWNRYAYALQNPMSLIDPSGLTPIDCVSGDTAFCTQNGPLSPIEDSNDFDLWWYWAFLGSSGFGDVGGGGSGGSGDAVGRNTSGTGGLASLPWGSKKREATHPEEATTANPGNPSNPGTTPPGNPGGSGPVVSGGLEGTFSLLYGRTLETGHFWQFNSALNGVLQEGRYNTTGDVVSFFGNIGIGVTLGYWSGINTFVGTAFNFSVSYSYFSVTYSFDRSVTRPLGTSLSLGLGYPPNFSISRTQTTVSPR